jgi:hypothetical protein
MKRALEQMIDPAELPYYRRLIDCTDWSTVVCAIGSPRAEVDTVLFVSANLQLAAVATMLQSPVATIHRVFVGSIATGKLLLLDVTAVQSLPIGPRRKCQSLYLLPLYLVQFPGLADLSGDWLGPVNPGCTDLA